MRTGNHNPVHLRNRSSATGVILSVRRYETPALEIIAHCAHTQLDAAFALDEFANRGARPQRELHLQLLWALFDNQLAYVIFLGRGEGASATLLAAAAFGLKRCHASGFVKV